MRSLMLKCKRTSKIVLNYIKKVSRGESKCTIKTQTLKSKCVCECVYGRDMRTHGVLGDAEGVPLRGEGKKSKYGMGRN